MAGESSLLIAWINFFAVSREAVGVVAGGTRVAADEQISRPDRATSPHKRAPCRFEAEKWRIEGIRVTVTERASGRKRQEFELGGERGRS